MSIEENDRQFEQELSRFAPLDVAPLPGRAAVARRRWVAAGIAAVVFLTIFVGLLWRSQKSIDRRSLASNGAFSANQMTLGKSEAVLLRGTSFDTAINQLEREDRLTEKRTTRGKHTAFEVLGRDGL